jgi:FkbH-like protein
MSFLEAHKTVRNFKGGPPLELLLAMSGTADTIDIFVRAEAARRGRAGRMGALPFNTLTQALLGERNADGAAVLLIYPWDLVPEADWRSGIPALAPVEEDLRARAEETVERISRWNATGVIYVPAPFPPLFSDSIADARLAEWLQSLVLRVGARVLPSSTFSLSNYLASGSPFASTALDKVAATVVDVAMGGAPETRKVLVTDLDNVLWAGVIGEDGVDGIACGAEGKGYRHFLYQTLLRKLKRDGVLLAAVSRNDNELAHSPFVAGRTTLAGDDFVAIVASYNAKSAQIRQLAEQLNLGLDAFVFVDDNPLELAEVENALPGIIALRFPESDDALPVFLREVADLFPRRNLTAEDAQRTELYRRRLSSMVPTGAAGADLTDFLRGLGMTLTIFDRSAGDRTRAVQLINKTNQFNLNGQRVTDDEVDAILAGGGRLYTAELADRSGSHGEIFVMLMDAERVVRALVMSCRVFQRRVEFAFFAWLANGNAAPLALNFIETPRNEPVRQFLEHGAFTGELHGTQTVQFDSERFYSDRGADMSLFDIKAPSLQ